MLYWMQIAYSFIISENMTPVFSLYIYIRSSAGVVSNFLVTLCLTIFHDIYNINKKHKFGDWQHQICEILTLEWYLYKLAKGIFVPCDRHNLELEHQLQLYKTTKVQVQSDPCF